MNQTISYQPRWFHIGDPDNLWFAIAYGIVALTTIWVLEHIFQRLLYSQSDGILLSDAAALVVYSGSGPLQLCWWIFAPKQRYCRRSFVAIMLRVVLVIVDVFIIILSIPRSIPILESDVLSTQLSFRPNASQVNRSNDEYFSTPCKPDIIQYEGFSSFSTRQLCFTSAGAPSDDFLKLPEVVNRSDSLRYLVLRTEDGDGLVVYAIRDEAFYTFTLTLSVNDDQNSTQYLLRTPLDIAEQAASAMLLFPDKDECRRSSTDSGIIEIHCPPVGTVSSTRLDDATIDNNIHLLYHTMGTEKVLPRINKTLIHNGAVVRIIPAIGSINRPRLSIFPALIVATSLLIVHVLLRMVREGQDLEYKLWWYIYGVLDSEKRENPLESACMKLSLGIANPRE